VPTIKYVIKVVQNKAVNGKDRTFHYTAYDKEELDQKLHHITYAFNLKSTKVYVNGKVVKLER
jgi:hypothetical protein